MFHIHWSFDRYWIYKMYLCEYECEKTNEQYTESPLLTVIRPMLNMLPNTTETCSVERMTSSECLPSSIKWSDTPKGRISVSGNHEMEYITSVYFNCANVIIQQQFIWGVWKVGGDADKSLAQPGRKQAISTKLGIYSTYSPQSSKHFLAHCSNFCKPLKKI